MIQGTQLSTEVRNGTRLKLPPMYTLVRVKPNGQRQSTAAGHIYDISCSGMRFELDDALPPGTEVEVSALLPGKSHTSVRLRGRVVRAHGDGDDRGPARMAMTFDTQTQNPDAERLVGYLSDHGIVQAA